MMIAKDVPMFEKLDLQTLDFTEEHTKKLSKLFPNCVTEAKDENGRLKRALSARLARQAHLLTKG